MHRLNRWVARALSVAVALASAAPASAAIYQYTSGEATITATGPTGPLAPATTFSLNGVFTDFDSSTGILSNFEFTTTPNQWIVLNTPYGGYDQIWVNSASVHPGAGYHSLGMTETPAGSGHWNISVVPVDVTASYTAKNSGTGATTGPIALGYSNLTPLNAVIDVVDRSFTLQGITLGIVPVYQGTTFIGNVTIGAVVTFHGATPVPEPASLALVALTAAALVALRSRS